jgi:hypothetical protein
MMKINWGTGIALVLAAFMCAMGYTIYLTTQNDYELVDENYYQQELEYDAVYRAMVLGKKYYENVVFSKDPEGIRFSLHGPVDSAVAQFIHPEKPMFDQKLYPIIGEDFFIPLEGIRKAYVDWTLEIKLYSAGEPIILKRPWNY